MLCDYGCGQEAKYKFKNGKCCCSSNTSLCPAVKKKKEKFAGENHWSYGKHLNDKVKKKISRALKGKKKSEDTKEKMSVFQKGKVVSKNTKKKISISRIGKYTGDENPNWKGGYFSRNIPVYDNFNNKLIEETRRNKLDKNILEVRCAYNKCNKWFIPKMSDVYHRIESINDINGMGESRLYCSDECKQHCSIFGLNYDPFEKKQKTSKYNFFDYHIFRTFVLERDNYECQYCGEAATEVHHERPQKLEPFFALDPDFAWSVCKNCHYEKGHRDECSTGKLATIKCK